MSTEKRTQLSIEELTERWGVSPKWVRRRIESGEIEARKFGALVKVAIEEVHRFESSRPRVA